MDNVFYAFSYKRTCTLKYSTLLLNIRFIKWMTSQAYNNDLLLFPLEIWKQPPPNKFFRLVIKRETECFEHLKGENTKPSVNVVSHAWFFYRPQVFYGFNRGEGRSDGNLIEWGKDVDVLAAVFKSLVQNCATHHLYWYGYENSCLRFLQSWFLSLSKENLKNVK